MLPDYLINFNTALLKFQEKFPRENWSEEFKDSLINDYSFYSARVEDSKLQYGDTIRFLNNESVRGINLDSLLGISEHQLVLKNLLQNLDNFEFTEETIKNVHASLMSSPLSWETDFKLELVGNYRNVPTVGSREPFFENKEYAPHYNLEIIMASYLNLFNSRLNDIDNLDFQKHLLTGIAYFHNKFLNEIHPFADGNGRVCRIMIGAILMSHNCPPIFPEINSQEQQIEYISKIVQCENEKSDLPLIEYFANGMTHYLNRI
ncbi:Fic family protein [Flavobacterium sp. ANB]|uniref:Fic family protein n=1 Tax=unclassified Flavobacterium TaxID=196869 RepID=UPI0012B83F04|nr:MULTISPECIES: Fic family protein [unclassified Flavobacterium]MBF4515551.1 Fic family protein [Flavobacterium sp. ANB]MTD68554.1 cell filamentation protein Fic [Flavobacterium sp. LC2016-13]